jgi:hypothetical protein
MIPSVPLRLVCQAGAQNYELWMMEGLENATTGR